MCHVLLCIFNYIDCKPHVFPINNYGFFFNPMWLWLSFNVGSDCPLRRVKISRMQCSLSPNDQSLHCVALIKQQWNSTDVARNCWTKLFGLWENAQRDRSISLCADLSVSCESQWISVKLLDLFRLSVWNGFCAWKGFSFCPFSAPVWLRSSRFPNLFAEP